MVRRSIQGNVVKRNALQQSVEVLKGLPMKEREELALREAIFEMLPEIEGVLDRGYSLDEVAGILSQNGVSIKGATLKQYLREGRKKRSRKRSRPSKTKGVLVSEGQSKGVGSETGEADYLGLEGENDQAGGSEPGKAVGSVEGKTEVKGQARISKAGEPLNDAGGKVTKTKDSGRKVGEFTEVPDDL